MPCRGAVFELRANISVVFCFLCFLIVCLNIPFNKFQGVISFGSHIFNVGFTVKVITNCDSKVFGIFSRFQFCIVNLNLNLNSLLVNRQIDNPSPGAVTGGN